MLTLLLRRPLPFARACWKTNTLTEKCKEETCSRDFWRRQATLDLGVSAEYFNLGLGSRERYVEIASRWYSLPGSEIFIDQGVSQLFAARDEDKCSLSYLSALPYENWSNALIGAALSGNYNFFQAVLNIRFSTLTNMGGIEALYSNYSLLFRDRLERAGALGGSEEIFRFLVPNLEEFNDLGALILGANVKPLQEILKSRKFSEQEIDSFYKLAFLSGKEESVQLLLRFFPRGDFSSYQEEAASSVDLLHYTGTTPSLALYKGYARAGNLEVLLPLKEGDSKFWTEIIEAATDSLSPLRWDIVKLALERGGVVTERVKDNAVLTGDLDLIKLVGLNSTNSEFLSSAVETGNIQVVDFFLDGPDLPLADYAAELGFGKVSILLTPE